MLLSKQYTHTHITSTYMHIHAHTCTHNHFSRCARHGAALSVGSTSSAGMLHHPLSLSSLYCSSRAISRARWMAEVVCGCGCTDGEMGMEIGEGEEMNVSTIEYTQFWLSFERTLSNQKQQTAHHETQTQFLPVSPAYGSLPSSSPSLSLPLLSSSSWLPSSKEQRPQKQ